MIDELEKLAKTVEKETELNSLIRWEEFGSVSGKKKTYPLLSFSVGSLTPEHPVLFLTGGFHGLERIGARLAWSLLKTTVDRLLWDKALRELFKNVRLVVIPLMNPTGYYEFSRSNSQGVDLMRNSPVDAIESVPFLVGGHRFTKHLPWYRGSRSQMETENSALTSLFQKHTERSKAVVSVDFHSGFGMRDRLWFPFSHTKQPFEDLSEMHALTHLFEETHPYHVYKIEPQSKAYLLNGDIWDFLYLDFKSRNQKSIYLPLTLEMGSWNWVKKNPFQIFSRQGIFNPVKEHRVKRTYRRHHLLFDFLLRAVNSWEVWAKLEPQNRQRQEDLAQLRWYSSS